ncbi:phytanoyl-CoA dioxygenase [Chromatiales bacterium (ex Bugula neritina AB1)]|nr:phytanoyl-CoA dioxygenase [Chromatiales bacterium (ex Bugula neritina AB1)]
MTTQTSIPTNDLTARYQQDGFFLPYNVLDESEAGELRADYEAAERELAGRPEDFAILRSSPDRVLPSFDALVRHPRLISGVSQLLGSDLLVWNGGTFIKEANSPHIVSWHQDLTYWGLSDAEEVTAWVALSPSTVASGCMRFIPGSHRRNLVEHIDTFDDNNLLSRGQEIAVDVDENMAIDVLLKPGQASLHHGHLFHASGPNSTDDRRIGVAIRYIKPSLKQVGGQKTLARLVSGADHYGHFSLADAPDGRLSEADFTRCREDAKLRREVLFKGVENQNGNRY